MRPAMQSARPGNASPPLALALDTSPEGPIMIFTVTLALVGPSLVRVSRACCQHLRWMIALVLVDHAADVARS